MPQLRNAKWEKVAQGIAVNGLSPSQAYISAGYSTKGAGPSVARMLRNANVKARVKELQAQVTEQVVKLEISARNCRVSALQERWERMRDLLAARNLESLSDRALLAELRAHEEQAAREVGQWQEKSTVTWTWDGNLESLTSAQREKLMEQLAATLYPGDPDALAKACLEAADALKVIQ